jgi:flagellar biosynthetic protein FliR
MSELEAFLNGSVLAFLITFVRIGTAIMIMPGVGDSFTPANVRLFMALGLALMLAPMVSNHMPQPVPQGGHLLVLIGQEFLIGLFFGMIARLFMSALDVAGTIMSLLSGLGNAQVFNPSAATQGSLIGAFLSVTGSAIVFASDMHHIFFFGVAESYEMFPVGMVPETGSMARVIAKTMANAFSIGFQLAAPFFIVGLLVYIGMGVLSRLMPQIQVFLIALPLQIMLAHVTLAMVLSAVFMFWLEEFRGGMAMFYSSS